MIRSFRHRMAEEIFNGFFVKAIDKNLQKRAHFKLLSLHYAVEPGDLRIPAGNRLETLKGDRKGQYSIRVNDQWRICFTWRNGGAEDVELVDYH